MAISNLLHLTDASFQNEVLNAPQPVLVDFSAEWCPPCKLLAPIIDEIAAEYTGKVKVAKIDIDQNQQSAAKYGIQSIPTVILFKGGQMTRQFVGLNPKKVYKDALDAAMAAR